MPTARSYDDPCGTARALDVIGERWALLTVRELLFGPKRFGQLRSGLPGISPNVLAQRLRQLEQAGILQRDILDPPASVAVYRLTDRGRALEPVLIELGRWGSRRQVLSDNELSVSALLLALKTTFVATGAPAKYGLQLDGEWFTVAVTEEAIDVGPGQPDDPDAIFTSDVAALRGFAFGRTSLTQTEMSGNFTVIGSRGAAKRFGRMFRVPAVLEGGS